MRSILQVEHLAYLSLIYFFLLLGYIFSLGQYNFASFWISFAVFCFLLVFWFFGPPKYFQIDIGGFEKILSILFIFSTVLALYAPKGLYEKSSDLKIFKFYLFLVAFLISISFLFQLKNMIWKNLRVFSLTLIVVLSQIVTIVNSPSPTVDVFDILQKASFGIFHGQNPYTMTFAKVYPDKIPDYYTYMPFSFLLTAPTRFVFGDIRHTFIFAQLIVFWIIYSLGRSRRETNIFTLLSLIFLFHPLGNVIIEEAWLDPLIVAFLTLFGLTYLKDKKGKFWSFLMIALAFGIKQNMLFILPFLVKLKKFNFGGLLLGFLPVFAVIVFFYVLSPYDFISDTLLEPISRPPIYYGLTIFSFFHSIKIELLNFALWIPVLFLLLLLKKPWNNLASFFLSYAIWFLSSLLFFKEAFLNQFYFVGSLLILTIFFGLYDLKN